MEEHIGQEKIHILTEYAQKTSWENNLRFLWRACFGDPRHYEDFYFDKVYAQNVVYAIEDKGMIHVNSYRCKVMNQQMILPYIVGVATDERYRRQGVMRSLLEKVLSDLYEQRVPFTYLMPANVEYYQPFGFCSVSERLEHEMDCSAAVVSERFQYLSYGEIQKLSAEVQAQLLEVVNQWLEQRYDVYGIHDTSYYELLYAEKTCQSGDVVFCFEGTVDVKHLSGVFAYAMDENTPYVEQIITRGCEHLLTTYFADYSNIKVVESYPYMFRIVHRAAFLEVFGERLSELCDGPIEKLTDAQMIEKIFVGKANIYFAEII